jgi:putrescine:ornithine antiporter
MAEPVKKMNVFQLTVLTAVNMMGSGIIMLPTNMAKVGAISLLSWIITAVGSMAIAYGFAQAGVLTSRSGGMAAYAEEAHGKSGFFMTFYLYFFSLAIGNVAIAISAVGYLSTFVPWLSSTPIATTIGVIGLIWLTTVANFGGPSVTGRIGAITVWGVIIPVAGLSLIGWFWFSKDTFSAAWNPQGLSLGEGMGSSISLTLWAFLGMESAAQNSDAVENPKRDVPLACMLGTLGAAVIYVLSTAVIQGIVPNAELAASNGPFGLAYAKMFSPTVGSIIMALAVMACLGSLLGWQFTIAMTGKSAADDRMFPALFTKLNGLGAPVAGMIVMGVVQTAMALSTMSPTLSETFGVLVNLAVVSNVVPYIISLSALIVMMQKAKTPQAAYRRNAAVVTVGLLYSVYAIYASGASAVLGGMIVMGIGYVIYGFISPRFEVKAAAAVFLLLSAASAIPSPASAGTLDQVRQAGTIRLGFVDGARPFSYLDEGGKPAGYTIVLCQKVADALQVKSEFVQLTPVERFAAVKDGKIDLLCAGGTPTVTLREQVSFSIPVFLGGVGALVRKGASPSLTEILEGRPEPYTPRWRASLGQVLRGRTFVAVKGTPALALLEQKKIEFSIDAKVEAVDGFAAGVGRVADGSADALFGDRAIILDAAKAPNAAETRVLDRSFTYEAPALALGRNDEDFRLAVDRALSAVYRSGDIAAIYTAYFGKPSERALHFFEASSLPE